MGWYLGIDTSNYTSSAALWHSESGEIRQRKQLLPVKPGAVGQRQSDAVFGHVKQLGDLLEELLGDLQEPVCAVAVSLKPRDEEGSYMPCFLAGNLAAQSIASALQVPKYDCSHQTGHILAALYGADQPELRHRPFLAFHVSGGTTQCLHVAPDEDRVLHIETVAESLDLHAGQAVDRVGAMLGLPFPAGPSLEKLALQSDEAYHPKPTLKGADCCLSGLQNLCEKRLRDGDSKENVARFCLDYLAETLIAMTVEIFKRYPGLPLVYAGGVMSNSIIKQALASRFDCRFAPPAFSADNAAGVAIFGGICHAKGN